MAKPLLPGMPARRLQIESLAKQLACQGPLYYPTRDYPHLENVSAVTIRLSNEESFKECYAWYAEVFSTASPYVAMYTPDDMNSLNHAIIRIVTGKNNPGEDCQSVDSVIFYFPGNVRWVRLWAYPHREGVATVSGDVLPPDPDPSECKSANLLEKVIKKTSRALEAPGGTDILGSWTFAPNGVQKWGVYSSLQPMFHVGNTNANNFIGVSVLMDMDIRTTGALNPDSLIGNFAYACRANSWNILRGCGPVSNDQTPPPRNFSTLPPLLSLQTGVEFARGSHTLNQVSSASVSPTFAVRGWEPAKNVASFSPVLGVEVGHNLYNSNDPAISDYTIFRLVAGADAGYRVYFYKAAWLFGSKPYTINASFRSRFPTENEVFTENFLNTSKSKVATLVQTPSTRARIYGRIELSQPLTRTLSATVLYQYGDLPPAYRFFGHTFGVSLRASSPTDYAH